MARHLRSNTACNRRRLKLLLRGRQKAELELLRSVIGVPLSLSLNDLKILRNGYLPFAETTNPDADASGDPELLWPKTEISRRGCCLGLS
jgi:hypothetical protein